MQTFMDEGVALAAGQEAEGAAALGAVASGASSQTRHCSNLLCGERSHVCSSCKRTVHYERSARHVVLSWLGALRSADGVSSLVDL